MDDASEDREEDEEDEEEEDEEEVDARMVASQPRSHCHAASLPLALP